MFTISVLIANYQPITWHDKSPPPLHSQHSGTIQLPNSAIFIARNPFRYNHDETQVKTLVISAMCASPRLQDTVGLLAVKDDSGASVLSRHPGSVHLGCHTTAPTCSLVARERHHLVVQLHPRYSSQHRMLICSLPIFLQGRARCVRVGGWDIRGGEYNSIYLPGVQQPSNRHQKRALQENQSLP